MQDVCDYVSKQRHKNLEHQKSIRLVEGKIKKEIIIDPLSSFDTRIVQIYEETLINSDQFELARLWKLNKVKIFLCLCLNFILSNQIIVL